MATLFVHSASLSLPQLSSPTTTTTTTNQNHHLNHRSGSLSLLSKINSHPIRRTNRYTTSGFRWMSNVGQNVGSTAGPTSVPVRVAHELQQAGHRYLDVRTSEEFSAGHPAGAFNIPYMFRVGSGMTKNPKFTEEVLSHFRKDDEIIVGCQSGKRSLMAAADLLSAGFTGVTDIAGGYAAWSQNGLPVES